MTTLEIIAALLGALSVWLSVRQHIWSWPTGIVNVTIYAVVFYKARLYADMGLQVIFALLSVYGWYQWLHGGAGRTQLRVSRTCPGLALRLTAIALSSSLALGLFLRSSTDASLPFLDSLLAGSSLVAQWMMTKKKLESWLVWIAVDVLYVGMYVYKALYITALLYTVFLALAVRGYFDWRRSLAEQAT